MPAQKNIPAVDIDDVRSANPSTIETVGTAFKEIGFVFIKAPKISKLLPNIFRVFGKVFNLPTTIKEQYARPDLFYQRGWTPPFTEVAIACRGRGLPDAKENWFMGPEISHLDPETVKKFPHHYIPNIWPKEVPEFRPAMLRLYNVLHSCGIGVLDALSVYLDKPKNYLSNMAENSPTVMRAIHYPPVMPEQVGKIIWACRHTDINFITVLPAPTQEGLWIRRRDGKWIPGNTPENCLIVQVGDMLQYLTGGDFVSAWHEVRAPNHSTNVGRFSAALFIHARSDVMFDPGKPTFPSITADEFLLKRLREIGLA